MNNKYLNINLNFMNTNLSIQEVAVLSYIESLTRKKGFCYASNKSICGTLKMNDRTLYRILNKLEDKEYIKRVTKSVGNGGKERKIYVSPDVRLVSSL
jgi:DNA-binding MarR family transcriptional regulator